MIDFKSEMKKLQALQELDAQIYSKQGELSAQPARLAELNKMLALKRARWDALKEELKQLQMEQKKKEGDLAGKEESVKKYQSQQLQVKTNKEYSALQHEIGTLKADSSMLEEDIIGLLDRVEEVNKKIEEEKEVYSREEQKIKEQEDTFQKERKVLEASLKSLESDRTARAPQVDSVLLEQYEKTLKRWSGVALVPIKGSACGGCFTNVPPQVINEVKLSRTLISCERCARILYCEE